MTNDVETHVEEQEVEQNVEEVKEEPKEEKEAKKKASNLTQTEIMKVYRNLKKKDPKLSFQDFCLMIANGKINLEEEDVADEK